MKGLTWENKVSKGHQGEGMGLRRERTNVKAIGKDSTKKAKLGIQEKKEFAVSPAPGKVGVLLVEASTNRLGNSLPDSLTRRAGEKAYVVGRRIQ